MEASLGLHVRPSSGYRSDLRSSTNHRVAIRRLPGSLLDRRRTTLLLLKAINGKGDDARELDLVEKAEKLFDETLKDQRVEFQLVILFKFLFARLWLQCNGA